MTMKTNSLVAEIGDTVLIDVAAENREWGYNPADNGTPVTIKGFGEIEYGRTNNCGHIPGVYVNDAWLDVELPGGKVISISHCHVKGAKGEHVIGHKVPQRLRDLPYSPIWEEDVVEDPDGSYGRCPNGLVVVGIDYKWVRGLDFARVSSSVDAGWHTSYPINDLKLKRRGPVWAYYHKATDAVANDIYNALSDAEEVNLHKRLGLGVEQRNPRTGYYDWTLSEALEDIRAGKVDALSAAPSLFGSGAWLSVYLFNDPVVGAKARALTLAGWANTTPEKLAELDRPHLERRERTNRFIADVESRKA